MLNVSLGLPKANHRNLTKVLLMHVNIEFVDSFSSVKRVANYCSISQIPVLVFFPPMCPLTTVCHL